MRRIVPDEVAAFEPAVVDTNSDFFSLSDRLIRPRISARAARFRLHWLRSDCRTKPKLTSPAICHTTQPRPSPTRHKSRPRAYIQFLTGCDSNQPPTSVVRTPIRERPGSVGNLLQTQRRYLNGGELYRPDSERI